MSNPGQTSPAQNPTQTPPPGLINQTPGGPGNNTPITTYQPNQANTTNANATPTTIPTNGTVQSQLQGIIASGSPLMEQAQTNAMNTMNQRGLINSSTAITAGQNAVIAAAEPIAAQDAQTYATAAEQTAAAQNAANLQNSQLATNTSQFNAGQGNAAFSQGSAAANALQLATTQIASATNLQQMQDSTQQVIAQLQSSTNLTTAQISAATSQLVASIQANTSLTNQQQQDLTQTTIAQMNNVASLQQIQAQGSVNTQIAQLNDQYGQLTQTDQAAQTFYSQSLTNLANIASNVNLSDAQKAQALQDGVEELNDGLAAIAQISGSPDVQSNLNFSDGETDPNGNLQ